MIADSQKALTDAEVSALERCCVALNAEIGRQSRVLDLCREQGRAASARDIEALDSATRQLAEAIALSIHAEGERFAAVMDAARGLGVAPQDIKLSCLIGAAPEPWRGRLADIRLRLKTVVSVTQRVVDSNARYFRDGARVADRLLAEVVGEASEPEAYSRDGRSPAAKPALNALLNVAG